MSETVDIEVEEISRPNPVAKDETPPSTTVGVSAREQKLLGFNPEHVIGDAFNLVHDYCCDAVDDFAKTIRKQELASDESSFAVLNAGVDELLQRCEARSQVYLERFEHYSREHCFSVPLGLLPEDEEAALQECSTSEHTEAEEKALDEELQLLRCQIASARSVSEALRNEKVLLQKEIGVCGASSAALMEAASGENLNTGTQNVTDKVADLRNLASSVGKYRACAPFTERGGNIDLQLQSNPETRVPLEDLCSLNNQLLQQ